MLEDRVTEDQSEEPFYAVVERASKGMASLLLDEVDGLEPDYSRGICLASIWDLVRLLEEELPLTATASPCMSPSELFSQTRQC